MIFLERLNNLLQDYYICYLQIIKLNSSLLIPSAGCLVLLLVSANIPSMMKIETIYAQSDLQTTKYRNMVIDLGNGLKTNARLNLPAAGDVPSQAFFLSMALDLMI
jgi:hypothetical protein